MRLFTLAISTACLMVPGLSGAQELSNDELLDMFNKQRDAFIEAETTGVSRTRSLSIVTVEPATTETAEATTEQTEIKPQTHGQLAKHLQINVRVEFSFDSAALGADQKPKLAQLCSVMKPSDIGRFRIIGHTDAKGSNAYNEELSLLRAQEVKRYFTDECGMAAPRLEAVGFGEQFPFNTQDPDAGENRRVEFQALS